jgi:hypothetical protein
MWGLFYWLADIALCHSERNGWKKFIRLGKTNYSPAQVFLLPTSVPSTPPCSVFQQTRGQMKDKLSQIAMGTAAGPLFWAIYLYELIPLTSEGLLICLMCGALTGFWATTSVLLIQWLGQQQRYWLVCRALAVVVALSVGSGIFWLGLTSQSFITTH